DQRAEPAGRARWRVVVGHRVGEEPQRRGLQRRMVAGAAVLPESGLHQQFRIQGAAATLGRRPRLSLLIRSWSHGYCTQTTLTAASHSVRLEESRADPQVLRG